MSREVLEPWASAMVAAQLTDPRNSRPSMRALAARAETTPSTISHMMYGTRETSRDVLERVIVALRMTDRPAVVEDWVGRARSEVEPFAPHPDANLLTSDEQAAVNEIIRLMALPKKQGGQADGTAAATNGPGSGPDDEPPNNVTELSPGRSTVRPHGERKRVASRPKQARKPDDPGDVSQE